MSDKNLPKKYREELFRHLDGIVTAPTVYTLYESGILGFLLQEKQVSLGEIANKFKANSGYLNVALRVLCSQGWLTQKFLDDDIEFELNKNSQEAFRAAPLYKEVVGLLKFSEKFHPRKFELEPFRLLEKIQKRFEETYESELRSLGINEEISNQVLKHIEGVLMGPTIVHLGMSGMFHKYFMEASFLPEEFHNDSKSFGKLLDFFAGRGWFYKKNNTFSFTDKGLFFAKRASAYGVTVSYIPTLRNLNHLIFGDLDVVRTYDKNETETHVDREMNVWGSGGAHSSYFKVIDEIIIELFNRPIEDQPKGILDMGCGNGAFIQHMFEVIEHQTLRGRVLDNHPLFLVGVDYNKTALKVTRSNLIQSDIWAKVMWGDIGKPDVLAQDLMSDYGIQLEDLLNVRTFLDHNRIWEAPKKKQLERVSSSTGAYTSKGKHIKNELVEQSLLEHFVKWKPYVSKFGLLVIELHTLNPEITSKNLGKTAATAYDATHGYSDQYILEVDLFLKIAEEAGLKPSINNFRKFPDSELATVTVNLLRGN